jgi:hypothetical protein
LGRKKENGRSPESVISTLLVHMNRYAKTYSKSAIAGSGFNTQEEFIYLINLKAFGSMTKMELIKKYSRQVCRYSYYQQADQARLGRTN